MNWDAIGALGEIAGAVAVFASLVYLALQMRQNTRAIRGRAEQETVSLQQSALQPALNLRMFTLERSFNLVRCLPRNRSNSIAQ